MTGTIAVGKVFLNNLTGTGTIAVGKFFSEQFFWAS
jgi:hypothetical protein